MSTTAIDTARTNERLSAFLSEIETNEPVDNYFPKVPVIEKMLSNKKMQNGGRQVQVPIDSGENSTVKDFSDYDIFDTTAQDTALTVVYPMINKGGSLTISWEEMREIAGDDHKIFDLIEHKRKNLLKTAINSIATDLFAAAQDVKKITALPVAILATGALGGLNQSTDADWASTVTASGSFAAQGLTDMNTLYNTLVSNNCSPDTIFCPLAVYGYYEAEVDPDVRYASAQGVGGRGFKTLEFKTIPLIFDAKVTAGTLYMYDSENVYFKVDTDGDFSIGSFQTPVNQRVHTALFTARLQLVIDRRKSTGKMTGITA